MPAEAFPAKPIPAEQAARPFLTADWRYLAMLNYRVDPSVLASLIPALDYFGATTYISLVGFRFERTRVRGLWIPLHSNFDEVNLRFYVRRMHAGELRRGVVFVREIVPRWAIAKIARLVYHENYIALAMGHHVKPPTSEDEGVEAEYGWRHRGKWSSIRVETCGKAMHPPEGSLDQFITEHYWGYVTQPDGGCVEYRVVHDPWRVWKAQRARLEGDTRELYGVELAQCLGAEPDSAFLAEGSSVAVYAGRRIA